MDNILFIAPKFYGYYLDIKEAFKRQGFNAIWYSDQLEMNYYYSFKKKLFKNSFMKRMNQYIDSIINENKGMKFKKIIIILGYDFTKGMVERVKKNFPHAETIYYTWDSVATYPNIITFINCFDRVYSFDDEECKKYGFQFLPLFYVRRLQAETTKYDYSGVMSYFPNKDKNLRMILDAVPKDATSKLHLYVKSKIYFLYLKLVYHDFVTIGINDISTEKLSKSDTLQVFSESKAVIDCPLVTQHGLTIRTFEVLSNGVKLITTNKNIKLYDFYTSENIFIVDEKTSIIPKAFFESQYNENKYLSEKYSVDMFSRRLLNGIEINYLK